MNPKDQDLALEVLKKLDEVKDKIHSVELNQSERLGKIEKILAEQEKNLEFHMKRSDALEKQVEILEKEVKPVLDSLRSIKILFSILTALITVAMLLSRFKS